MVIRNLKRKVVTISITLIGIGFVISMIGFGIGNFDLNNFKSTETQKWYKTINIDEDSSLFSIEFWK